MALCMRQEGFLDVIPPEFGENRNSTAAVKLILLWFTTKYPERQCPHWAFFSTEVPKFLEILFPEVAVLQANLNQPHAQGAWVHTSPTLKLMQSD